MHVARYCPRPGFPHSYIESVLLDIVTSLLDHNTAAGNINSFFIQNHLCIYTESTFYLTRRDVNYIYIVDADSCSIIHMSSRYILTYIEKATHRDINVNRIEGFNIIIICHSYMYDYN